MEQIGHFIGGKRVAGTSGRTADVFNPATGEVQAQVALASADELTAAVANAKAAQPAWAATNPQRRARVMMKFVELLNRDMDKLAEVMIEAGLPEGILNVVNGDKGAVDAILDDPDIQAIGFVGSTPIAQYIYSRGCANGKRVQCFGGAKNHMIIMPDADIDKAADALIGAGYGAAGERCMAVSVAVPVGKVTADRLMEKLIPRVEALKIAPYTAGDDVDMGPLVTREAQQRVLGLIDRGVEEGAKLAVDGRGFKMQGYENGFFVGACLFDDVTKDMDIYKTEIFGPVLSVVRAKDYEEAIDLPMSHEYGNGVSIYTRDGDAARDFASRINIGMVGVNVPIPVPLAYYTFGGWKASGFGDLNQHGPDAFRFYTRTKTVTSRWPSGIKDGAEFAMPVMR
jgi:malonate-semialdehyde dehydrogenase (acetylating)/methylmalonate-semialdehyde dehydrogenase